MAVIACKECGGQVSTTAKSCPQCGARLFSASRFVTDKIALVLFTVALFVAILWVAKVVLLR